MQSAAFKQVVPQRLVRGPRPAASRWPGSRSSGLGWLPRKLLVEPLEDRRLLSAGNLAEVVILDGERLDPSSPEINYLGGNISAESGASIAYTEAVFRRGRGAYEIAIADTLQENRIAFVQTTLGATGFGEPYLDTRDLTHYAEITCWIRNATGKPFTLELGIKDFTDSNRQQARWIQPVKADEEWIPVHARLDFTPKWVGPAQAGWAMDGQPDLARARSLSIVIAATQGFAVSGSVFLDDLALIEPGDPVDPAVADVESLLVRLARRQFDALWGARDRANGLLPSISAYENVLATNATAALVKSLPGAVVRGWISRPEANRYVETLAATLSQMMDKAHYLPARYVDRVTLEANYLPEESSIDAAMMYLALYQYRSLYETPADLRGTIDQLLGRFDFLPFATAGGWRMAFDLPKGVFASSIFDSYTGEIGLISLAAHLAGQLEMAALYHSGMLRDAYPSLDGSTRYVMHSSDEHQAPFLQWILPLFVDVSGRGPDNYPDPTLASNPLSNAVAYQADVVARLDNQGRSLFLQPDAGNDWRGERENYRQYSVFQDFGQPGLFMPWSIPFVFLADPGTGEASLRRLLEANLDGPFGFVDSAYWDHGQAAPRDVAARTDLWNAALSLLALEQYLYEDNAYLASVPAVASALDQVFHAREVIEPAAEFLLDSAAYACGRPKDGVPNAAALPLYTEYLAGDDYLEINDVVRMSLDGNDPDAARGRSSFRATWDGTGPNGYFQFGLGPSGPRDIPDFGFAHGLQLSAKGDAAGQQVAVHVYRSLPGGGWQQLVSDPPALALGTEFQEFTLDFPEGIRPAELHAVQFVLGDGRPSGNGTFWLDDVQLTTDGCDPARLILSYRADPSSSAERDLRVYPNRSYLYDNALAVKALWATGDTAARAAARRIADAIASTALPDGSYRNQRNAGHALLRDGTPRGAYGPLRSLGDNAWWGLALLDLHEGEGDADSLDQARAISDWAEAELKASGPLGGYRGGYDETGIAFPWRSTEHNTDLFALNRRLADRLSATGDPDAAAFAARAAHAGDFVIRMFDGGDGKFWTGTLAGDAINTLSVPLDAQLWPAMALGVSAQYAAAIDWSRPAAWADSHLRAVDGPYMGYAFSDQATAGGVWFEGTAQAAALYAVQGQAARHAEILQWLEFARLAHPQGDRRGMVAASRDATADPQLGAIYDARLHAGATAWLLLARQGVNPFVSSADHDPSAPRAVLDEPAVTVIADSSYQPGLDPLAGVNLVSWWNFGSAGSGIWEDAVQDAFDHGFRAVSLVPVRFVDLATGAIAGGPQAPEIAHVAAGMAKAMSLGMTVTVNPLVEPRDFSQWRGSMQFDGAAADRFFQDYEDYLEAVATAAAGSAVDRMTVGSELKGLTAGHADRWSAVIESVATVFPGQLGYAANWDEYAHGNLAEAIWDNPHIDFLGVDLYPPLATDSQADASGTYPDASFIGAVQANWEQALLDLRVFAAARKGGRGMPVVLTEIGITPYNRAATRPHSSEFQTSQPADPAEQANAFDALLRATDEHAGWLPEFYLWHWAMDGNQGSPFVVHPDDPLSHPAAELFRQHLDGALTDFGSHSFTVTYADDVAVDAATLDGSDILVSGPNGVSRPAALVHVSAGGSGTPRSATYRVAAPGGSWDRGEAGTWRVLVQPDQVFDVHGRPVAAGSIGAFTVDPAPWQFPADHFDVDASGAVVPLDVLRLINSINLDGSRRLTFVPPKGSAPPPFYDVNGDQWITPEDVLDLINEINARISVP